MDILLDMDEVLVDFVGAACRAWGLTDERTRAVEARQTWDCVPALSEQLGLPEPMTPSMFWSRINGDAGFWLNLRPMPWFDELIELVCSSGCDWYVVSSPSACPSSYAGKAGWLKERFGGGFDRLALSQHKTLLARPGAILVDDKDEAVKSFITGGGLAGVVFPRLHNSMRGRAGRPVAHVASALRYWKEQPHARSRPKHKSGFS